MKEIILVRHGENVIDDIIPNDLLELSSVGINQAKKVSKILNNNFDIIISSPSKRTFDTAKIISNDKEIIIDDRLLERGWYHSNGNETDNEAKRRFKELFDELEIKYKEKTVLLVTHGALIRLAEDVIENKELLRDRVNNCDIIRYKKSNNMDGLI